MTRPNNPADDRPATRKQLDRAPTGIEGLDEITSGGLPKGRPTLLCGGTGCGKTLLALEFLVRGATEFDEPGVFMSFEETALDLIENAASLGFDLPGLVAQNKLVLDHVHLQRSEMEEAGSYDLEGLFIRLDLAIRTIGARRVVLDTLEVLFANLGSEHTLRSELHRLFLWLKARGVTAIITAEQGEGRLTRHGLEEYVSDCVIRLDHRVSGQVVSRSLRVVKYRGSMHGTNEYPFLIEEDGMLLLPVTSLNLEHIASTERVSTGIPNLDAMLGGQGYYRGSSILVSGTAGTGKSSFAACLADAACRRGEPTLYFSFEESPSQILRNMRSIGIDLKPWVDQGLLRFWAARPTLYGLEMHLATMHREIRALQPRVVIVDPLNSFIIDGNGNDVKMMLMRLVDYLKGQGITGMFTSLVHSSSETGRIDIAVSSLIDTWLLLNAELEGPSGRSLTVLKSRGMAHSGQPRSFRLTERGVALSEAPRQSRDGFTADGKEEA